MAGQRLEIGFHGGNVLRATLEESQVAALTEALGNAAAWYQLDSEEGIFWIKVTDLQFIRIPGDGPHGVGFSHD